jgi:hypothetical protein
MILLLREHGLAGLAVSRLFYGSVSLVIYLPLIQCLRENNELRDNSQYSIVAIEAQEGSKP